jgi:hypothetical protein
VKEGTGTVPDRFRAGAFDPEFVTTLVTVLREACDEIEARTGQPPSEHTQNALAKAIMTVAEQGETNPAVLKSHALASLPGLAPGGLKA